MINQGESGKRQEINQVFSAYSLVEFYDLRLVLALEKIQEEILVIFFFLLA